MKKIILTALVAIASITANAQVWVGGQLGFSVTNNDATDKNLTEFTIAPEIGYSLSDKWDIAIALGDKYSKPEDFDATNDFFVNPYARYTFFQTGKVGFFLDGGFSIKTGDITVDDVTLEDETMFGVGIRPGVKFAASDKVTFVASFGGLGYKKVEDEYSKFGFNVNGNALQFGCYYSF